jgi:hypothetical protein
MKITEEQIKQIILEEVVEYLEEVRGLDPEQFQKIMKYIPFTKQHRQEWEKDLKSTLTTDVYLMVMGKDAPDQWPELEDDRGQVANWLANEYPDISRDQVIDPKTGIPRIKWPVIQKLVKNAFRKEIKKKASGQSLEEIIKEEINKYLKENE